MTYWIYKKRFIDCTKENKSSWDMIKDLFKPCLTILVCMTVLMLLLWAAEYGMKKELCARNYTPEKYREMKIIC